MLNLNLSQKSLLLIGVPLVFQLVFVGTLGILLRQSEYETWRERHAKEVIAESNGLLKSLIDSAMALYFYSDTGNHVFLTQYDKLADRIPEQIQTLKTLLRDSPEKERSIEQLEGISSRAIKILGDVERLSMLTRDERKASSSPGQLVEMSNRLVSELREFVKKQERSEFADPQAQERSRMLVVEWLIGGIVLNIALCLFLAMFFNRSALQRINVMVDNTVRLSKGNPLNEPVSGSDEISQLDRVFHEMAQGLEDAARHKKEMIAMVGHDLRTPLTCVQASLALISARAEDQLPQGISKELAIAESNTERLIHLINDLLDIEKMEAGQLPMVPGQTRLAEILEKSVFSVEALAHKCKIDLEIEETDALVYADKERLIQVCVNLLSNSIKFSPAGSTIKMQTSRSPEWVEVRVVDQGRGIPAESIDLIFERFAQVKASDGERGKGTGLGLAICKAIISGHKGQIGVDSKVGEGSSFWFRVPPAGPGETQTHSPPGEQS